MPHRIEVGPRDGIDDPRGRSVARQAREFLGIPVDAIRTRTAYKLDCELAADELERARAELTDPVTELSAPGRLPLPAGCQHVITVGFRPGVTDNLGRTARVFLADLLGRDHAALGAVHTETVYAIAGERCGPDDAGRLAHELLANPLIEEVSVLTAAEHAASPVDLTLPSAGSSAEPRVESVELPAQPEALLALSRARTLSLSLAELETIRAHYASPATRARRRAIGLPDHPTDVELEAFAQTWSEHCKHKIFNARIDYRDLEAGTRETIHSLFKTFIVEPTREIARDVDWLVSVFDDNAGVVRLGPDLCLVYKVETHNSPSALDPYGGAMTGIVGVNRDPLGTGLGAELLTNVWGYCLASPFHAGPVPEGLLHPRRIRDGVHRGVIDGGNQSGIPMSRGFEVFDDRYLGKPLVFCGTVGLLPDVVGGRPGAQKEVRPGDVVVMVGGRIGKDGIHGATFSSEALHGESPAQAVQIGDPITQKMMSDLLLEARELGLYRAITDNGAGGLSSSVGELARLSGGAELDLERAPLKYEGLHPWEILLSEAQERMTLAVPPDRVEALLALAQRREVEATPIGTFTDAGVFRLRHRGQIVGELEMEMLHEGCPQLALEAEWRAPRATLPTEAGIDLAALDPGALLPALLGRLNLCSRERKVRHYDHEVKGLSVVKPLCGVRRDIPADATVMRVRHGQPEVILLAEGIAPRLSDLDAGAMAAYVVDLAARRIVAGGGRLGRIAGLDNFCWPDPVASEGTPDGRQKLAALVRACQALARMTRGLGLPCISGKDSMKNDSTRGGVKISIPPTLLFSTIGWLESARAALDLAPRAGDGLYVIGETRAELGASELLALLGERAGLPALRGERPPATTPELTRASCLALEGLTAAGLASAAHAPHLGGLAVGVATMCLAGGCGAELELDAIPVAGELLLAERLFAESSARFLCAVPSSRRVDAEALLGASPVRWARIGELTEEPTLRGTLAGRERLHCELDELARRYREPLDAL